VRWIGLARRHGQGASGKNDYTDEFDAVSCLSPTKCVAVREFGGSRSTSPLVAFSEPLS
jgi:hypothetical protein